MSNSLLHPEWINGVRVWNDPAVEAILDKIQYGDTVRGWEGDPKLTIAIDGNGKDRVLLLVRAEGDGYSLVARSKPGTVFDERIIDELVARDMRRTPNRDLHAELEAHNEGIREGHRKNFREMLTEEISPRIRRSLIREGWL